MYLFIHIPRTGGTTFRSILTRNFKDEYIGIYGMKVHRFFTNEEVKTLKVFFPKAKCISAHKFVCPLPFDSIVFVRDPIERAVSHYFLRKKQVKIGIDKPYTDLPFGEWFDRVKEDDLINSEGKWSTLCNMQDYVIKDIDNPMFIGITERMNESLLVLKKMLGHRGIDFKIHYFIRNSMNRKKTAKEFLSKEDYQKVLEDNKLDIELYKKANEWLDHKIDVYWRNKLYGKNEWEKELKRFNTQQKILGYFSGIESIIDKGRRFIRNILC